jgi:hypothetical protein
MVSAPSQVRYPEGHRPSDPNEFHFSPGLAEEEPSIDGHRRQRYFGSGGFSRHRPSVGRQVFRAFAWGLIIVAIAGIPMAWQFSDDNTKDMVTAWAKAGGLSPSKLPPVLGTKSPPPAAETMSKTLDRAPTQEASDLAARFAPAAPQSVEPRPSAELPHQLEAVASDLAVVRRLVEQLAAKQDQMAQELTTLQTTQLSISQKLSQAPETTAVHVPPHKNGPKPSPAGASPQSSSVPIPAARPGEPLPLH